MMCHRRGMLAYRSMFVIWFMFRIPSCYPGINGYKELAVDKQPNDDVTDDVIHYDYDDNDDDQKINRMIRSSVHKEEEGRTKKAITPRRTLEYQAEEHDHHNETRRPGFPMKDVAPDIIFKYPKGNDPSIDPIPVDRPPAPALQPQINIPPPPPPPAPIVINTGSGPAVTITQAVSSTRPDYTDSSGGTDAANSTITSDGGITTDDETGGSGMGGNAASYNGMGGDTGGDYKGSGPAMGGEKGLAGPYWPMGSGSGIGQRVEPYRTSPNKTVNWDGGGADWIGTMNGGEDEVPNQAANVGKAGGNNGNGGGNGVDTGGNGGRNGSGTGGGGTGRVSGGLKEAKDFAAANGSYFFPDKCKQGGCESKDLTPNAATMQMFKKLYNKFITVQQQIRNSATTDGRRPTQIARGMLTAELYKVEDIINNLNKKIDIIGDRVIKRPNLLGRAALMAGMTSTFGSLENTVETLNEKLDESLKRNDQQLLVTPSGESGDNQKSARLATALEKLGAAGWLGVNGPAIGFTNYEMAAKAAHLEGLKMATLKTNERLEDAMNLIADRLMGLQDHMDHIPDERDGSGAPPPGRIDPLFRQEQQNLMITQSAIVNQMSVIQDGLEKLAGAVKKLQEPPPAPPPINTKAIGMVQSVLKSAADAFQGIAKQTTDTSTNFANHMVNTVANAEKLIKSKEIKNLKYPFIPGSLVKGSANVLNTGAMAAGLSNGVSGLAQTLGGTSGIGAAGNPFIGSPFGLLGANEGITQEHIPQLAAAIASLPSNDPPDPPPPRPITGSAALEPVDTSMLNYGTFGNGRPLTVVTGNLGGSLGLGGIGGIDGGNALVQNEIPIKKEAICQSDIITCVTIGTKRSTIKVARNHLIEVQNNNDINSIRTIPENNFRKRRRIGAKQTFPKHSTHLSVTDFKHFKSNKKRMKHHWKLSRL